MPPPIPNKDHEPITVGLAQILSLTFTLLHLKFLRGLAALCCFRSTHNCLVRAARRAEDAVVYHFLNIIPSSFYNPRVQIPLHALGSNIDGMAMGNGTGTGAGAGIGRAITDSSSSSNDRNAVVVLLDSNSTRQNGQQTKSNQSPVMDISPSISPALRLSQRIPELATQYPNRLSRGDSMIPPRSSTGSQYSSRGAEDRALGSGSLIANMESSDSLTEKGVSRISAEQFVTLVSTPDFSSANVSGQFVAESGEQPQVELVPRPLSHQQVDLVAQQSEMQGLHLSRSVESYPGNFPVSEGLEYSGLATVPGHIRGRGTTSVRPFSDV